ncbi:MAG: ferritin family protein [Calditrichaeota bacterium]|nr:ferritin family protein [Calditrichota bacterium]
MTNTLKVEDVLKVAINAEISAYSLYQNLSEKMKNPAAKQMLVELALQEEGHRKALERVVATKDTNVLGRGLPEEDRGIHNFLQTSDLHENASVQEVMVFAMNEEQKAYDFYMSLRQQFVGTELEDLFDRLAAEERGHKVKLEDEYEQHFMTEN